MKILFVTYSYWPPGFGGELLNSIERFASLSERGHEVTVLTSGRPGFAMHELHDCISIFRSPIIRTSSRIGKLLRRIAYVFWVLPKLFTCEVDAVHFGTMPGINRFTSAVTGLFFAIILRLRKTKTVFVQSLVFSEKDTLGISSFSGRFHKLFLSFTGVLVSVSPRIQTDTEKYFKNATALYIPYGVRDDIFIPLSPNELTRCRLELGFNSADVIFVFLGSIGRRKGFDILAEAFSELCTEYPDWRLLVIGPRSRQESQNIIDEEVKEVTAKICGNPNVMLFGRIDDRMRLSKLIGSSDIFAFPSRREGMGIAPMEAMSAGVPPIIARIHGVTDQASIHNQTGLYVSVDDVNGLKEAMIRLGADARLRREFGSAARHVIEQQFSWQKYIDKWEELYGGDRQ